MEMWKCMLKIFLANFLELTTRLLTDHSAINRIIFSPKMIQNTNRYFDTLVAVLIRVTWNAINIGTE